eukprot:3570829-Amphidinium_carterae.1
MTSSLSEVWHPTTGRVKAGSTLSWTFLATLCLGENQSQPAHVFPATTTMREWETADDGSRVLVPPLRAPETFAERRRQMDAREYTDHHHRRDDGHREYAWVPREEWDVAPVSPPVSPRERSRSPPRAAGSAMDHLTSLPSIQEEEVPPQTSSSAAATSKRRASSRGAVSGAENRRVRQRQTVPVPRLPTPSGRPSSKPSSLELDLDERDDEIERDARQLIREMRERGELRQHELEAYGDLPETGADGAVPAQGWQEEHHDEAALRDRLDRELALSFTDIIFEDESESIPFDVRARIKQMPLKIKQEVRRAHCELGHCDRQTLMRLCRLAGKSASHLEYARWLQCPACLRRQRPLRPPRGASQLKPSSFNSVVGLDLKQIKDAANETHNIMHVLDLATRFSICVRIKDRSAMTTARKFWNCWIAWAGAPLAVMVDLGNEWRAQFEDLCGRMGTAMRTAALEAPWQIGAVERAGATLGEIARLTILEAGAVGKEDMKLVAVYACKCKNSRVTRSGFSARMHLFGSAEYFPGGNLEGLEGGENEVELAHGHAE